MSTDHLKSLAQRIENLMDERDGIQSDIRDIYAEAKSHGYVPKVLRKAITRKRMDAVKRDEEDAILELYEDVLGPVGKAVAAVRAGATWKDAAEKHSVPRATLARAVKVSKQQTDTAEITPPSSGGEGCGPGLAEPASPEQAPVPGRSATPAFPSTPPQPDGCSTDSSFEAGNQAHEGEDDGCENDSGRGEEPRDRSGNPSRPPGDAHGEPFCINGRQSASSGRHAGPNRESVGPVLSATAIDQRGEGAHDDRSGAGLSGGPAFSGAHHERPPRPLGGDQRAAERDSVDVGRGVDAPSTPPLGAVAEGESPERVARPNDGLEIPQFLRRTEARRAGT